MSRSGPRTRCRPIGFALLHESGWLAPFFFVFALVAGEMGTPFPWAACRNRHARNQ
jgi:hypothetical protein